MWKINGKVDKFFFFLKKVKNSKTLSCYFFGAQFIYVGDLIFRRVKDQVLKCLGRLIRLASAKVW